jgi:predicted metalloendopeptidase
VARLVRLHDLTRQLRGQRAGRRLGFNYRYNLDQIGKPVDKTRWGMSPQTVNAYYNPQQNEIVFPAAILQPPFFDPKADDALNYGGIGAVIGHEMIHGYDDQGSRFGANGNFENWWTDADKKGFEALTAKLKSSSGTMKRCPRHTSTASSPWARTSPTSAALPSPSTR